MANFAPAVAEAEIAELPESVTLKVDKLVEHVRKSKHLVAFTGAGVSTSAGIPDFRGPQGVWTLRAQGKEPMVKSDVTLQAVPTATHMALVELHRREILKFLVSQNCDGLHRRSGIPSEAISEVHGNSNREVCKDCGKDYIRDFRAVAPYDKTVHDHRTGRKCTRCGGNLHDTIVNFGEYLPEGDLERARNHAKKSDVMLVLGSSLTVPPANGIPETAGRRKGAKLVICNLQSTYLDPLADLRVRTTTDDLMTRLMDKLDIPIPPFVLTRNLVIEVKTVGNGRSQLTVSGVDDDGTPVSFLKSVRLRNNRRVLRAEPFTFDLRGDVSIGTEFELELEFMGHYLEPNLEIVHIYDSRSGQEARFLLEFHIENPHWTVTRQVAQRGYNVDEDGVIVID